MCGKSAYSWKTSPTRRSSGFRKMPAAESNQTSSSSAIRPRRRPDEPRDRAQHRGLAGARRARRARPSPRPRARALARNDRRGRRELCREGCQRTPTLRMRRIARLRMTSSALIASAVVRWSALELVVDRERQRLRPALEAAGEQDRRAELAEPAREAERLAGEEPAARERQRDPEERPQRPGAERPRRGDHRRSRPPRTRRSPGARRTGRRRA